MYKTRWFLGILLLAIISFAPVKAEVNIEQGKELHDGASCASCHKADGKKAYLKLINRDMKKRKVKRKIASYDSLYTQVQACVTRLSIGWFPEEVANVTAYLNAEYYKFKIEASQ